MRKSAVDQRVKGADAVDPSKKERSKTGPGSEAPKTPSTPKAGDSYQPSRTGHLKPLATTRRLASNPLGAAALDAMKTEIGNGQLLISKLQPRITVLQRALAVTENPARASQIFYGVGAGEVGFTKQVIQMLQGDARALRQVQVALSQWQQALNGIETSQGHVEKALSIPEAQRGLYVDEHCQVEKLRGQLYPLINLHVVFRDNPLLAQLVPTPKVGTGDLSAASGPATASDTAPPAPTAASVPASLEQEVKAVDAAVAQVMGSLKQATGSLRNKLIGFLGGVPKDQN